MATHDPVQFTTALSAKLATRSRHVCMLLGAGAGRACNLPDVAGLQDYVLSNLDEAKRESLTRQLQGNDIEYALSRLRKIAALVTGTDVVDDLTAERAQALDTAVCQLIVRALDLGGAKLAPAYHLAAWSARASYRWPLEIFTLNYDLLLESALDALGVPYFDGFLGNLRAKFHTELVEGTPDSERDWVPSYFVRLWKLHGSVNWVRDNDVGIVRLGHAVSEGQAAAIFPSDTKYEESRRVPFLVLQDRLRRALNQPETIMLVVGYSFRDRDINELLFDAATRRERSEIVAFCRSVIPDALAQRASATPNIQVASGREAIIGGVRADWKPPAVPPPNLWEDGRFSLADFANLAVHLSRSATREPEGDAALKELLGKAAAVRDSDDGGDPGREVRDLLRDVTSTPIPEDRGPEVA